MMIANADLITEDIEARLRAHREFAAQPSTRALPPGRGSGFRARACARSRSSASADTGAMSDWEVFARRELDAPIRHVGTVAADRPEDAEVFAWKLYDEWSWKQMFVVPRASLDRLVPDGARTGAR
jgi:hypothetical protein